MGAGYGQRRYQPEARHRLPKDHGAVPFDQQRIREPGIGQTPDP
jgi:hypothetical protein